MRVDLPAPFSPMTAVRLPAGTRRVTSCSARTGPKCRDRPSTSTATAAGAMISAGLVMAQPSTGTSSMLSRVTTSTPVSTSVISVPFLTNSASSLTAW